MPPAFLVGPHTMIVRFLVIKQFIILFGEKHLAHELALFKSFYIGLKANEKRSADRGAYSFKHVDHCLPSGAWI